MVFEQVAIWVVELAHWGITILVIMLAIEVWKFFTFDNKAGEKVKETGSSLFNWAQKKNPLSGEGRKQRNVERDAKREKTKILNEFIEEKKELELVEKAIEENNSLWVALENLFNLKIPPITPKIKEIKDLFTDLNKTVTELDREFSRLNRATYKQERACGKLIEDLEDSEVNKTVLEQAKVYEKEILKFHDLAIKSLNRVKTMLGQLKTVAFDLSPSKWLKTLGTDNFGSPHFYSELKAIYSDLEEIKKAEEQVITQTEELISYFQKYWKQ